MYSGIVNNYGKVTLPSVAGWNTNMNIVKDPPKSITTRKIDKVGETTAILEEIAASGDRICESISRYAKGVNPMVSVAYNNHGGTALQSSNVRGQAYLPYRIAREGAFRPPIRRQEDLLPLSRMPRVWTTVLSQCYAPNYAQRIKSCGTAENTKEVKTQLLRAQCQARKVLMTDPDVNAPYVMGMVKDPLVPMSVHARKTAPTDVADAQRRRNVILSRNHPLSSFKTNAARPVEQPVVSSSGLHATRERVHAAGQTNAARPVEQPVVSSSGLHATKERVHVIGRTNRVMRGEGPTVPQTYRRLPDTLYKGGVEGSPCIPSVTMTHPQKQLMKVR